MLQFTTGEKELKLHKLLVRWWNTVDGSILAINHLGCKKSFANSRGLHAGWCNPLFHASRVTVAMAHSVSEQLLHPEQDTNLEIGWWKTQFCEGNKGSNGWS